MNFTKCQNYNLFLKYQIIKVINIDIFSYLYCGGQFYWERTSERSETSNKAKYNLFLKYQIIKVINIDIFSYLYCGGQFYLERTSERSETSNKAKYF